MVSRPVPDLDESAGGVADQARQCGDVADVVVACVAQQLGPRWHGACGVLVALVLFGTGQIHQPGEQVGRRDAVGQGVVHLADESEAVVGQSLGEVEFPQRVATVQRAAGDLADHLVEFAAAAGSRHLHPAQVIVEVDFAVLHPHRVVHLPRDVDEAVAQRVQQMQAAPDRLSKHVKGEVAVEVGGVDDRDLHRVGVQIGRLAVQQHGVHAVESLHVPPRSPVAVPWNHPIGCGLTGLGDSVTPAFGGLLVVGAVDALEPSSNRFA